MSMEVTIECWSTYPTQPPDRAYCMMVKKSLLLLLLSLVGIYKTFGPLHSYWNTMFLNGANDFASFYCSAHLISHHTLYNSDAMAAEQLTIVPDVLSTGGPFPYIRLPYFAAIFWPLSHM